MRSEPLAPYRATPNGIEDAPLIDALAQRSEGVAAGEPGNLDDLMARDACGPSLFTALAQRFGWKREGAALWVRERVPRWTPGWVQPHHEPQWMALFESAFGYRMADDLWKWKYRNNPLPGMGAWRGGELVAFYGGMTREVLHESRLERTVQIGDVMTRPDERGVLTRTGPFQVAAATFIERCVGYGMPNLFGYGFPTDKALKVAQRLGLYEQVDQMMELAWTPADPLAASLDTALPLEAGHAKTVDRLWLQMADAFASDVVGLRDAAYLQARYQQHPLTRYDCLLVRNRLTRVAKGVVVLRDRGDDGVEVLDLVGDPAQWPDLVRAIRRLLVQKGRARAYLWTTRSHAGLLDATLPQSREMELMVPANVWTPGPTAQALQGKWWLTGGDTDFR